MHRRRDHGLAFATVVSPHGLGGKPQIAFWAVAAGVLLIALATLLMYRLMERIGPEFCGLPNYLVPVYAVLLGAAVLGERSSAGMCLPRFSSSSPASP